MYTHTRYKRFFSGVHWTFVFGHQIASKSVFNINAIIYVFTLNALSAWHSKWIRDVFFSFFVFVCKNGQTSISTPLKISNTNHRRRNENWTQVGNGKEKFCTTIKNRSHQCCTCTAAAAAAAHKIQCHRVSRGRRWGWRWAIKKRDRKTLLHQQWQNIVHCDTQQ